MAEDSNKCVIHKNTNVINKRFDVTQLQIKIDTSVLVVTVRIKYQLFISTDWNVVSTKGLVTFLVKYLIILWQDPPKYKTWI